MGEKRQRLAPVMENQPLNQQKKVILLLELLQQCLHIRTVVWSWSAFTVNLLAASVTFSSCCVLLAFYS